MRYRLGRPSDVMFCGLVAIACLVVVLGSTLAGGTIPIHLAKASPLSGAPDAAQPLAPGGDFPTYLGDPERTSSSSSELLINLTTASALRVLRDFPANGPVRSQPVEQNGILYFGTESGYEYAEDAASGAFLWKSFLGVSANDTTCPSAEGISSTASVADGQLYVDGGYPYFYSLNSSTGAIEWRTPIGGTSAQGYYDWSSPLIYADRAYVGISSQCDDPQVAAGVVELSLDSGEVLNYFNSSAPGLNGSEVWGSPAVDPSTNMIFITTGAPFNSTPTNYSESIVALNADTLAVESSWQLPPFKLTATGGFQSTPTVFDPLGGFPMVTAVSTNGILYAFYQSNLTLAWEYPICCQAGSAADRISTAWGGGYIYAAGGPANVGGVNYGSAVWAFDPLTGTVVWVQGFSESSSSGYAAPLYANGLLIVPDQGALLELDAGDGSLVYEDTQPGIFAAPASISRGEVFAGSTNGNVYAWDLSLSANATQTQSTGTAPLLDSFNVTASGGLPPYSFGWTFGDGGKSVLQDPRHTYSSAGTYTVTVVATDLGRSSITDHLSVVVSQGINRTFVVSFTEVGLTRGTPWSVTLNRETEFSSSASVRFILPNGTYSFTVGTVPGYSVNRTTGSLTVNGGPVTELLAFAPVVPSTYSVTFLESGLPFGTNWSVTFDGTLHKSPGSSLLLSDVLNGTYPFSVTAA
ncbi:MAG: PQQ-binding-like beta-propeller repeat protein, partial [Thermoplasmata archaeon]